MNPNECRIVRIYGQLGTKYRELVFHRARLLLNGKKKITVVPEKPDTKKHDQ